MLLCNFWRKIRHKFTNDYGYITLKILAVCFFAFFIMGEKMKSQKFRFVSFMGSRVFIKYFEATLVEKSYRNEKKSFC